MMITYKIRKKITVYDLYTTCTLILKTIRVNA